jgi:hypothetical protein
MDIGLHYLLLRKGEGDMDRTLAELEAIVRNRVCGVCIDGIPGGECALEEPSNCALFRLFPQVAEAIQSVSSNEIRPYLEAIRQNVCTVCADRVTGGSCETRQQVWCSLDAYLPLVVEAIEEATGKTFDKNSIQPTGGPIGNRPNPQLSL